MEHVEFGVASTWSLFSTAAMFWLLTLLAGVATIVTARRWWRARGRKTGSLTGVLVLVLCGVVPIVGGYAGCAYRGEQIAADLIDRADQSELIDWSFDHGAAEAKSLLGLPPDDQVVVDVAKLRTLSAERARERGVLAKLGERAFWWAVDATLLSKVTGEVTWGALMILVKDELKQQVRTTIEDAAGGRRSSSRRTLLVYLAFLALAHGLTLVLVRRSAAAPPTLPVST